MDAPKRPNYFPSQFLVVRDFKDEQLYHQESLRRHNSLMHVWGVRDGLEVKNSDDSFVVTPGSAIDSSGYEIILEKPRTISAAEVQSARQAGSGSDVYVTIKFREVDSTDPADQHPAEGGTPNVTRKVQSPVIELTKSTDGMLVLARIAANGAVNNSVRKFASSVIAKGTSLNLGDISLDGALSFTSKTSQRPTDPQVGLDYDSTTDQLRIRARTQSGSSLDTTHLNIRRDTGNVGIGTNTIPQHRLEVDGALKLANTPQVTSDYKAAYFWNQADVGPTIGGFGFEVRTGSDVRRFRIDSTGNVGIGTFIHPDLPRTKLHIKGNGSELPAKSTTAQSAGHIARLKGSTTCLLDMGSAGNKGFWLQSTDQENLATNYGLLLNPNGGNVGIGTTEAPKHALEVIGALKLGGEAPVTSDGTGAYFWNQKNVGPTIGGYSFEVRTGSDKARLKINESGNVGIFGKVSIDGNVGIGTDPKTSLHIRKDNAAGLGPTLTLMNGSGVKGAQVAIDLHTYSVDTKPLASGRIICEDNGQSTGDLIFQTKEEGSEKMLERLRLYGAGNANISGNLGIGISEPKARLDVGNTSSHDMKSILARMAELAYLGVMAHHTQQDQVSGNKCFSLEHYFYNHINGALNFHRGMNEHDGFITLSTENGKERLRVNSDGLTVNQNVNVKGAISCGGIIGIKSTKWNTYLAALDTAGHPVDAHQGSIGEWEQFTIDMNCSREFKENISDLSAHEAMTTLQNLTPVKYDYKSVKAFRQNLGFIAEDMPDNLASEDRKSISPFEVVPILTRVAKEQQRVIAELQETVRTLHDAVLG